MLFYYELRLTSMINSVILALNRIVSRIGEDAFAEWIDDDGFVAISGVHTAVTSQTGDRGVKLKSS